MRKEMNFPHGAFMQQKSDEMLMENIRKII